MEDSYSSRRAHHALRQPASSSSFSSRISSFSDIAQYDVFADHGPNDPPLHGHASLASRDSQIDKTNDAPSLSSQPGHSYGNAPSAWSSFTGYSASGAYKQVPTTGVPAPARKPSKKARGAPPKRRSHATIPEEDGIDLGLLQSAAPVTTEEPSSPVFDRRTSEPLFDLSSALGPSTLQDEAFLRRLQEREAQGQLTGGLGQGMQTEATLTQSDLLAASPTAERGSLRRSLSLSGNAPAPGRSDTVRQLGQSEANKRGEVIAVVPDLSQPPRSLTDLSLVTGPVTSNRLRQTTFPMVQQAAQIFYPQPNWKPFSMRWPWLIFLIFISVGLAVLQEVIYQISRRQRLVCFHSPSEIPPGHYFAFKFVPTMLAVSYGVLWQMTDFEVKRLEAFYQLSKDGGALADESINVDYITHFSFFRPFRALYCKHYAVAVSTIASLLASAAVPTLGAATIVLWPDRATRDMHPDDEKCITVDAVWSRFLSAVLVLIAFLGCILFYQLQTRRSGLLSNVQGIAGLASMAVVSHILMDFKDMDVATHKGIHHRLKDHRYVLRNSSLAPDDGANPVSKQEQDKYTKMHLSENPHPAMLRAEGCLPMVAGIVVFAGLLPLFLFTPANVVTEKAPWIVTALAVCLKLGWAGLESDLRMMEPYYILSRRHAPPKTLTLDYTALPFGLVAFRAAMNAHWLVFLVTFGTVMTEVLTVLVTSLATVEGRDFIPMGQDPLGDDPDASNDINAGQETVLSFWVSLGLALFILLYMGIMAAVVFVRRRRVFLPRQPNTIASVLAFLHQSKMLYHFVGTAKFSTAEMVAWLEGVGRTYGLGWFQGRDGQSHCGVDEEELLSGYKFGYDYSMATKPWEETQVEWL